LRTKAFQDVGILFLAVLKTKIKTRLIIVKVKTLKIALL
jgi:hypothetical protein